MKLPLDMVSKHVLLYLCLPDYFISLLGAWSGFYNNHVYADIRYWRMYIVQHAISITISDRNTQFEWSIPMQGEAIMYKKFES